MQRFLTAFVIATSLTAAPPPLERQELEVVVERRTPDGWGVTAPGQVLDQGDQVRFRLTSNVAGRLYVYNRNREGRSELIFPNAASTTENRLAAGEQFLMPRDGAFSLDGPAGHEVIYWVVSPEESREPPLEISSLLRTPTKPPRFNPSCDETVLRARSICIDQTAGAQAFEAPNQSTIPGGLRARAIEIRKGQAGAVITSPRSRDGFIIFEYRLAHR